MKEDESEIKNENTKKIKTKVQVVTTSNNAVEVASTTTGETKEQGNVVLKNEKIEKKSGENKNCC